MKNEIIYFGIFDTLKNPHGLKVSPACCNKMEYVAETLIAAGYSCKILSIAQPNPCVKFGFIPTINCKLNNQIDVKILSTIGGNGLFWKILRTLWGKIALLFFLLFKLRKGYAIALYHTPMHLEVFCLIKLLFRHKLILETEEIYNSVSSMLFTHRWLERYIFKLADGFIFPTELLNDTINTKSKPYTIIYGNYHIPEIVSKKCIDKTHVVYSGTFNPRKGGAMAAISSAEYLGENYHLHVTGWGRENEISDVKELIKQTSLKTKCEITFDGFVDDNVFFSYLQRFHIGINSQNPNDILSSACFPSKILVYMGNGLSVVSSKTEAIERSKLADSIIQYDEQCGQSIADAIKKISVVNNNRKVVNNLHLKCINEIRSLFIDA